METFNRIAPDISLGRSAAIVTKSGAPRTVFAGNPAHLLRTLGEGEAS